MNAAKNSFSETGDRLKVVMSPETIADFIRVKQLPSSFERITKDHFLRLAAWLSKRTTRAETLVMGINGAQGTGKSTLADFLKLALESSHRRHVAVLSIDDFYLTKLERRQLAKQIHPLLATRGVPGTHDVPMLEVCLKALRELEQGRSYRLPRFDKAKDDRADESLWPTISGRVDLVIIEGWCVGSVAQHDSELAEAVNDLERTKDPGGAWRRYVNERLSSDYARLFAQLDALVFLEAPSFDAVFRWRVEQEAKLLASAPQDTSEIMDEKQIAEFIQHYERITRNNLSDLPSRADVILKLDEHHDCVESRYRT